MASTISASIDRNLVFIFCIFVLNDKGYQLLYKYIALPSVFYLKLYKVNRVLSLFNRFIEGRVYDDLNFLFFEKCKRLPLPAL